LVQTVVSTWTIGAAKTRTVKIEKDDLDGKLLNNLFQFHLGQE